MRTPTDTVGPDDNRQKTPENAASTNVDEFECGVGLSEEVPLRPCSGTKLARSVSNRTARPQRFYRVSCPAIKSAAARAHVSEANLRDREIPPRFYPSLTHSCTRVASMLIVDAYHDFVNISWVSSRSLYGWIVGMVCCTPIEHASSEWLCVVFLPKD